MKLTFFLIALGLVLLRLCYPTLEIWHNRHGHGSMVMRSDNYIQEIDWSGKVRLSDDERSVAEISPGGYLNYRENDTTLKAESNLQGEVSYKLYNGHEELSLNDSGRQFIAVQIRKMIDFGFFGEDRARRIYEKGGIRALLAEIGKIKMEGAREPYLNLLLKSDSLTQEERIDLLQQIGQSGNESEQQHFLSLFSREQLLDSAVARQWLSTVGHIGPSYLKKDLLLGYVGADAIAGASLSREQFDTILAITARFESDADQQEVYQRLAGHPGMKLHDSAYVQPWLCAVGQLRESYIQKDLLSRYLQSDSNATYPLPAGQFDTVVTIAGHFQSSVDEQEIYKILADLPGKTETEWADLIRATGKLNEDYIKSDLLLRIAPKMPRTDSLLAIYRMTAKSIQGDMDYGKVMRALE